MNTTIERFIEHHSGFSTKEFADLLRQQDPNIGRSTIYKKLQALCAQNRIARVSRGHFISQERNDYRYEPSDSMIKVLSLIRSELPLVDFQVWELYQMNEFVNHQFSKNTLFFDVEPMLDESVFELIFGKYPNVLFDPSPEEYYRYMGEETFVIRRLITESPPSYGMYRQASLEKILVDLFGKGLPGSIIARLEYPAILRDAFSKYTINEARLFRYARRRGVEQRIREFIRDNTDIILEEKRA